MRRPRLRCEAKEQTRFSSEQTTAADCFQKREKTDCEQGLWSESLSLKQQLPIESNRDKRENLQRPKDPDHSYINPCLIKEINLNQYIAENVLNWSGKCDQFCQRCFERTNGQTDRSLKSSLGWNLCFKQLWLDQDKGDLELTSSWSRQCLVRSALPGAAAAPRVAAAPGSETPCRSRYTVARWSWSWSLSHDHDVDAGCPGGASPWEASSKAGRAERRAWRRESRQQVQQQQHHNPTNWKNADLCPSKSCAPLPLFLIEY